jgi:Cu(I)/Ag(I) efflux system periplasmic protein CusF
MKQLQSVVTIVLSAAFVTAAHAHSHGHGNHGHANHATATKEKAADAAAELVDGEVRKIDKDAKKITLKHGEIKSLDMTPMTMVFQVKDVKLLDGVKVGDKVKFTAERAKSGYVVSTIQVAK